MNNFTRIFVPLFCLGLLLVPIRTNLAKEISDLHFQLADDVNIICPQENKEDIVLGCIVYGTKTVYIRKGLYPEKQRFVIAHEIGHYYLQDVPAEKLKEMIADETGKIAGISTANSCSAANEKKMQNDVVEMSASLFFDYSEGLLGGRYPKMKDLYDGLVTM
jgi:hypothetical protein